MTYEEVLNKLTSKSFFSKFAGLARMQKTMDHFGNPETRLNIIHVAGTNGKGSVCAMLNAILTEAGYRVGLFTSPYLHDFRERIQFNGELIGKAELTALCEEVFSYTDTLPEPPNQFELLTVLALLYFERKQCDFVILETGLGGTYDPTNIVPHPLCDIIMNIGLDHCAILGNTIKEIAAAKAGIIKDNTPVVLYPSCDEAIAVIKETAEAKKATVIEVDKKYLRPLPTIANCEHFRYRDTDVECNLLGRHQQKNCAVALEAVTLLRKLGYEIPDSSVTYGLSHINWPARMELLNTKPAVYLDGGHNPQCISAAEDFFSGPAFAGRPIHVLTGILADKDYRTMLALLRGFATDIRFWRFDHPRAIPEAEVELLCEQYEMTEVADPVTALTDLLDTVKERDIILCIGSLYMTDRIRQFFKPETDR